MFCVENDDDAQRALNWFTDAYLAAGINLASDITTFCRWGVESLNFHQADRATNGPSDGVNTRIEVLDRIGLRLRLQSQLSGPGAAVLLGSSASPGELRRDRQ